MRILRGIAAYWRRLPLGYKRLMAGLSAAGAVICGIFAGVHALLDPANPRRLQFVLLAYLLLATALALVLGGVLPPQNPDSEEDD